MNFKPIIYFLEDHERINVVLQNINQNWSSSISGCSRTEEYFLMQFNNSDVSSEDEHGGRGHEVADSAAPTGVERSVVVGRGGGVRKTRSLSWSPFGTDRQLKVQCPSGQKFARNGFCTRARSSKGLWFVVQGEASFYFEDSFAWGIGKRSTRLFELVHFRLETEIWCEPDVDRDDAIAVDRKLESLRSHLRTRVCYSTSTHFQALKTSVVYSPHKLQYHITLLDLGTHSFGDQSSGQHDLPRCISAQGGDLQIKDCITDHPSVGSHLQFLETVHCPRFSGKTLGLSFITTSLPGHYCSLGYSV
ncbi:hypothetical protein J6590_071211 [Homalodisca vitripennis]|nr:hypothetical protein J6590_071211 [Homalodisca vitripennis]